MTTMLLLFILIALGGPLLMFAGFAMAGFVMAVVAVGSVVLLKLRGE
jgi:hypothetical protein